MAYFCISCHDKQYYMPPAMNSDFDSVMFHLRVLKN